MKIATIVLLASTVSAFADPAIVGRASVIDGDTIEIHGERIRFNGIDAPEARQKCLDAAGLEYRCGRASTMALDTFLAASVPTNCTFVERDRYRRFVGNCFRADGKSVSSWMVRNGYALDWPRYSKGRYAPEQETAAKAKTGMWSGTFETPWEWRKR